MITKKPKHVILRVYVFHCVVGSIFPSDDFDPWTYRSINRDLQIFDKEQQLLEHYSAYGKDEGRIYTEIGSRKSFLDLLIGKGTLLEIGPFDRPTLEFLRANSTTVDYADWLSKEQLVLRASQIDGRNPTQVPDIKYVLAEGWGQIEVKYDAVVSHHCIEHQPDLIRHFLSIKSILNDDGWYLFSLPDKRFCFDHFIPNSNLVDVLEAYYLRRESPSLKSVLEHRCFTSHTFNDGINPYHRKDPNATKSYEAAVNEYASNSYVDVHCWQFTLDSFKALYGQLVSLSYLPEPKDFKGYQGHGEFYVAIAF